VGPVVDALREAICPSGPCGHAPARPGAPRPEPRPYTDHLSPPIRRRAPRQRTFRRNEPSPSSCAAGTRDRSPAHELWRSSAASDPPEGGQAMITDPHEPRHRGPELGGHSPRPVHQLSHGRGSPDHPAGRSMAGWRSVAAPCR
jgi:hypothetical protein